MYIEKTSIVVPPSNQTVTVGSDVTLYCTAITDPLEQHRLKITWLFNDDVIEFALYTNVAQDPSDNSLKIIQAQIDNTGSYTCNASTELDWDAVTVQLTVSGVTFYMLTITDLLIPMRRMHICFTDVFSVFCFMFFFVFFRPSQKYQTTVLGNG